jgi:hypothetical protein
VLRVKPHLTRRLHRRSPLPKPEQQRLPVKRSAADLEKLVAPIALHPDPLIAIILPASAYPLEIVQAARFVKDTNNIPKVDDQPWDDNVKELAKFPDMIAKMDADLPWTMELGQAFIDQSKDVLDMIQNLRGKAKKAGTLQTTTQQIVTVTNVVVMETNVTEVVQVTKEIVQVVPSNPQVVYVPTYPPTVYYPPPAYVYNPLAPLVTFGVGMAWGAVLANNCNWGHGDVNVNVNNNVNRNTSVNRSGNANTARSTSAGQTGARASSTGGQKWQPDQSRMSKSGAPSAANSARSQEARGYGSGGAKSSTGNVGARPSTGTAGARPSTGSPSANRPTASPSTGRASPSPGASQSRSSPAASRSSSSGSAFGGSSSGASARSASSRGSSSRSSGGFSGGGGGGARGGGGGGRGGGGGGGRR